MSKSLEPRHGLECIDPGYWLERGFEKKNPIKLASIMAKAFVPSFFSRKWSEGPTVMFIMTALEIGLLTSGIVPYLCARAFFLAEESATNGLREHFKIR